MSNVLIVAAGEPRSKALLRWLARRSQWVIAADGGTRAARRARIPVNQFVGDGDSLTKRERVWLEAAPFPVRWHPVEKDQTDLELALELALERKPDEVNLFGGWGLRADHTLSNLFLLERAARAGVKALLWTNSERLQLLLPGEHFLESAFVGQRVSFIPLSDRAEGIVTQGLRYPLRADMLARAASRGVSNEVSSLPASLGFSKGLLLAVHEIGTA